VFKIFLFILFFITLACNPKIKGPNYNISTSHNNTLKNRNKVVKKEDLRMKNAMIRHREKYSRGIKFIKRNNRKKKNKYI